jgi:flagellar basal body-associated protein FliL
MESDIKNDKVESDKAESDTVSPVAEPVKSELSTKKKSKLPLIIVLIVAGVLVLGGIGFAIWWFAYYNSDNKVLSDAFYNTLSTAEGTGDVKLSVKVVGDNTTTPDMSFEANIKTSANQEIAAVDIDGKFSANTLSISASANTVLSKNGDFYVKVNDLDKILGSLGLSSTTLGGFDASRVSNKWIKISQDDLKGLTSQTEVNSDDSAKCIEDITTTLVEKKDAQKEILDAITSSKALTAKRVGSDKDGIKFELNTDVDRYYDLLAAAIETDLFKSIGDCAKKMDSSIEWPTSAADINVSESEQAAQIASLKETLKNVDVKVNFWVGAWDHKPTRMSVNVKMSDPQIEFVMDVTRKDGKVNVAIPSDSTNLESVIQDLQGSITIPETIEYDDI